MNGFPEFIYFLFKVGAPLLCAFSLLKFFAYRHSARLIVDTPTARVRSAPQGYVELIGRAQPHKEHLHRAPFSREYCVWHDSAIYSASSNNTAPTIWRDCSDTPFVLEDDTGRCLVDPTGADIDALIRRTASDYDAIIDSDDMINQRNNGNTYRFVESVIRPGDPLYALGEFRTIKQRQKAVTAAPLMWPPDPASESWTRETSVFTLGRPSRKGRPYLLGGHAQHRLANRYRLKSLTALAASLACAVISVTIWLH